MPLQNRVDPSGRIHAVAARGLFTGNRGVIHDPQTRTLLSRRWTTKAWIICTLEHPRGVKRDPMGRNAPSGGPGWTELFFLDEVTALAAGHRPCFYCRREAAAVFLACSGKPNAPALDATVHEQRTTSRPRLDATEIAALPDGTAIGIGDSAFMVRYGTAMPWSFSGYGPARSLPEAALLLTPMANVMALKAGYEPLWHATGAHMPA
ncbi:hypothetical protein [Mesorhizobium sp. CAU 1741]|uniref:hypothetical protein n=1 Tax=Mesorhizobium sp. CAU 1741 TaxID=3140366 RepID=UPI00325ACCA8